LGLSLPGTYYFLTYTTCMTTPHPAGHYWRTLWKWLTRYRPGICCCYGITGEGKARGVIHIIIRIPRGTPRLEVTDLRAHWQNLTGATQLKIVRVPPSAKDNLAAYISDQRKKRGLAGEMAWQDYLERWRWTSGWLPTGFTKAFGRVWHKWSTRPEEWVPRAVIEAWLMRCHEDPNQVNNPP